MPLMRKCLTYGCPNVIPQGRSRCDKHGSNWERWRARNPHTRSYASPAWKRRRAEQLRREPNCRECGAPASHVDHVQNVAGGGDFDSGPLQSLCPKHHRQKTAHEGHEGRWKPAGRRKP